MDSTPEPCTRCDGTGSVRAIPTDHTSPALEAWVEAHRSGVVPPIVVPRFRTSAVKLSETARARAEYDWADLVARAGERPGAWLDALAYIAAEATNRDAVDIAGCWGLAR